jgi:hypothetical protein
MQLIKPSMRQKHKGRDRVILHETLLRQIIVVEQEKTLALQHSNGTAAVPRRGEKFGAATQTKLLMSIESDQKLQPFTFSDSLIQIANRRRLEIILTKSGGVWHESSAFIADYCRF